MPVASYPIFNGSHRLTHQPRGQCPTCGRPVERVLVGDASNHENREWVAAEHKWPHGLVRHQCKLSRK